ncbi:1-(5-phosphoribosyl)-5-[(5-phosphoribosylamino) methylideneamino]imidazole-4-carboxamide isomerase [Candidatus Termititenax persephonae]|uniref:1-(5-phosphoribosyl)-5-[(5-phosphoribosylamino)methylideneamino] imidazole-4-carboxamide isomerase n=1 Tax=Candidatus Termititenax persephonae TaxID=2218525 RepID=A0A388TFD8_9BACT|nr:1-(5-phosphoribosyl)-5-[(5-phosphoribosylamino) methylideneamino]imidazole-4-carboxamide isomerase [Candidatus Termititenax persephonae]
MFKLIPAIDILGGQVVRLTKGDYAHSTVYDAHPAAVARKWEKAGARLIHLVDLDGAKAGRPVNLESLSKIRAAVSCALEVGGGLRTEAAVEKILALGIDYAILGSAALKDQPLTKKLIEKYADKIIIGIDARQGQAAAEGWLEDSGTDALNLIKTMEKIGAQKIIYTEITRDGTLGGVDTGLYQKLADYTKIEIIASGGAASVADVQGLARLRLGGVIIGKALYEGKIPLSLLAQTEWGQET